MPAPRSHQQYVADITYVDTGGATWFFALSKATSFTFAEDTSEGAALATEVVGHDGYTTPALVVSGAAWNASLSKVEVTIPDFTYTNSGTTTIQADALFTACCPSGHTRKVPQLITESGFNASTDVVTLTGHGYVDGDSVVFRQESGTIDTGITTGTIYEIMTSATNTFQITLNGVDPVILNGDGASLTGYVIDATLDDRSYTYKSFASPLTIPPGSSITVRYSHGVDTIL